jgi:ATP-dependent Zn protease
MTQVSHRQASITATKMVGHSLVRNMFAPGTVTEVTIVPSAHALGRASYKPADTPALSLDDMRNEGIMHLAGMAAVHELTGSQDTGCSADALRAYGVATRYIAYSDAGLSAAEKDERARALVAEWYEAGVKLVREKNADIRRIVDVLVEKGTLTGEEFSAALAN